MTRPQRVLVVRAAGNDLDLASFHQRGLTIVGDVPLNAAVGVSIHKLQPDMLLIVGDTAAVEVKKLTAETRRLWPKLRVESVTVAKDLKRLTKPEAHRQPSNRGHRHKVTVIVIAASTGGPAALSQLFAGLRKETLPPVLVVQHMPEGFTAMLADRLNGVGTIPVQEANDGVLPEAGRAYVAPGGRHLQLNHLGRLQVTDDEPVNSCKPSADLLFSSAARLHGAGTLGVVLTGMGVDGTSGARDIVGQGGSVLCQDKSSSVVWGMPGSVVQAGLASDVVPLDILSELMNARMGEKP